MLSVHLSRRARPAAPPTVNEEMKLATSTRPGRLAAEPSEIVALAYGEQTPRSRPDYLDRAFDPRLITNLAPRRESGDGLGRGSARRSRTSTPIATS